MDPYQLAGAYSRYTNRCIFLTGKAGTGKTTFLRRLQRETNKQLAIVAPTGVAAINAGGTTIHSFFQLPPQLFLPTDAARQQLFHEMQMRKQKIDVLRNLELLVIDEISMVRCDLLDALDAVLRHYRRRPNLPFGGVQLLMIGDLYQLSPVAREYEWDRLRPYYDGQYFFHARVFREVRPIYIELDHVFRQTNQAFVEILNEVRENRLSAASRRMLNSRFDPTYKQNEDDFHIILSTHNQKVDTINEEALAKLDAPERLFSAKTEGTFPESMYPIDVTLRLKEGARVMFVKNDSSQDKRYYNGKLGIVRAFSNEGIIVESDGELLTVGTETWENIRYTPGSSTETLNPEVIGTFTHYPLRLAWAITIHKSQGLTFDSVVIDAADAFAAGQVYVALSRCRTLEGIVLLSEIPLSALSTAPDVLRYTAAQPSLEVITESLPEAERTYLTAVLTDLYDFREFIRKVDRLRAITSGEARFSNDTETFLLSRKQELEALQPIGERFQNQLRAFILSGKDIAERLKGAAGYFLPLLTATQNALRKSDCSTDNKDARQSFEETINELNTDLCRRIHLITIMGREPHLEGYFKGRSTFRLPAYFISAGEKEDLSETANGDLLRILFARRRRLATEAEVDIYEIARTDSLKEIAAKLPTSKKELMKVKNFGKKKYDIWGEEILKTVRQYCAARGFRS